MIDRLVYVVHGVGPARSPKWWRPLAPCLIPSDCLWPIEWDHLARREIRYSTCIGATTRDVYALVCDDIRDHVVAQLLEPYQKFKPRRVIVVAHSLGTMLTLSALRRLSEGAFTTRRITVDHLITLGSPLAWLPFRQIRRPPCVQRWSNVYSPLDCVTRSVVRRTFGFIPTADANYCVWNWPTLRSGCTDCHSMERYLARHVVRELVAA